jgi:hypothetical protein
VRPERKADDFTIYEPMGLYGLLQGQQSLALVRLLRLLIVWYRFGEPLNCMNSILTIAECLLIESDDSTLLIRK